MTPPTTLSTFSWFAWGQVVLCLGAAVQYAVRRDHLHTIYWVAAAILTTCVNLMQGA